MPTLPRTIEAEGLGRDRREREREAEKRDRAHIPYSCSSTRSESAEVRRVQCGEWRGVDVGGAMAWAGGCRRMGRRGRVCGGRVTIWIRLTRGVSRRRPPLPPIGFVSGPIAHRGSFASVSDC